MPVSENKLCQFVAFLRLKGPCHQTAKSYLSAVRHLQIFQGMENSHISSMPGLELVIRDMKQMQAGVPSKQWLPITPAILQSIRAEWNSSKEWDHFMLWAAMCLCFFGFLRAGKTVAPETKFDTSQHLIYTDIAEEDLVDPKQLQVNIKQSKTDLFRLGVKVWIGITGDDLCSVAAILSYMALQGLVEGPLFYFQNGNLLMRQRLITKMQWGTSESGHRL